MLFKYEHKKLIINKNKLKDEDKNKITISMGKKDLIIINKEKSVTLIYELKYYNKDKNIFGYNFINNNIKKIRIVFNNREKKYQTIYLLIMKT